MFFDPPREIPARRLIRLPDHLRRLERTKWADANPGGAPVDSFLEGSAFDAQGRLYVTDIPNGRIFRIEDDHWTEIADYRHSLIHIAPETGGAAAVLQTVNSESFKGLNDLTSNDDESMIFTDHGQTRLQDPSGRVWRLHKDGRIDRLLSNGLSPNGLVLNTAQTHLSRSSGIGRIKRLGLRPAVTTDRPNERRQGR